ncbi:MAG: undecaprenyldiphospho-muramoylpentapeptide beta-N-acetylglucosaminyltransferase [Bacteroidales bacterium]|nr:undecaprenyldiphospho-muramoylpentapeptide beta-N-acetylglucosaminyltransferase [Bacteroidales bacterium]MBN2699720.1 undecaprenyldiphospho-muramoylpentapeptide beta-N-acetylglucosaminyltransferase [Bacteroidales bacterium]
MKKNRKHHRILIGGGGTGGHVFPAIAIAKELSNMDPGAEILFVGARNRLEMEKVPESGFRIIGLPVAGFQRQWTLKNITFFFRLFESMRRSGKILKDFKPDVAVGVGGYASGPILRAAARRGIPILIQEQNSFAGLTNRLLARHAQKICVAYEGMEKYFPSERIILTGNPVRPELKNLGDNRGKSLDSFNLKPGKKTILLLGGSLGAHTLNQCMKDGISRFDREDLQLLWQTGKAYYESAKRTVEDSGLENIMVVPFISEMNRAFAAATIIISRAGAVTLSELCLVGKPVILVPSPNVAGDHQTKNAEALVSRKAAIMIPDNLAEKYLVGKLLDLLDNPELMKELSVNISKLAIPDSAERIANEIIKLIEPNHVG